MLIDLVQGSDQKVTLLVTGAQTDVALALEEDPTIADNIAQIVIMGGAFNVKGNLYQPSGKDQNNSAEWNIFVDPLAAKQVFASGIPLTIVPLDGSDGFVMRWADHARIQDSGDPVLRVLTGLWEMVLNQWGDEFRIWDIVAATALTNPEHFEWVYDGVDVVAEPGPEHGKTYQLGNSSNNARFAAKGNYLGIRKQVFTTLLGE
jgi:inosine-uridine nucleoside N-ribohydrolase